MYTSAYQSSPSFSNYRTRTKINTVSRAASDREVSEDRLHVKPRLVHLIIHLVHLVHPIKTFIHWVTRNQIRFSPIILLIKLIRFYGFILFLRIGTYIANQKLDSIEISVFCDTIKIGKKWSVSKMPRKLIMIMEKITKEIDWKNNCPINIQVIHLL